MKDRIIRSTRVAENGCWNWAGGVDKDGYGKMQIARVRGDWSQGARCARPHRVAYEEWVGKIPDGLVIDHLCENPGCCNPDHLMLNTNIGNVMRGNGRAAQNARKTHCIHGHELSGDNLHVYEFHGRQWRRCQTCYQRAQRDAYKRKKQRLAS